ncbi:hypothetical protein HDA40_004192 [Hamadaea flava]|uniref:ABC transporter permease n=1 Tax=Hamadaea flava TaxID=1742688 RepID=A0ABV8LIT1_9ACTN|nr:hypothetical protein [Hamadaea flava]MCP2325685.1 hypothetical protein [Hamadaea flava]
MKRAALLAAVVIVAQALLIPLFVGPAANMAPRDLPIAVAGPGPATSAITAKLQAEEGAFTITQAADATAADQLIRDREVYGAFVVTASGVEVHTAPAASPVVATLLSAAAAENNAKVVAVVPLPADDPRGAGFTAGFLPLLLTGMLAGILLVVLVPLKWARLLGSLGYAVGSGLIGSVVLREWLGVITGNYWADAAAVGLVGLAASALVAGLGSVFGPPGIGLGALTVFLVGNPLSGVAGAPELLPQPWGDVGQHLPAGAGATLLRSVAFFDGAGSAYSMWVLIAYAVGGLALIAVGRSTRPAVQPVAEPVREPVAA